MAPVRWIALLLVVSWLIGTPEDSHAQETEIPAVSHTGTYEASGARDAAPCVMPRLTHRRYPSRSAARQTDGVSLGTTRTTARNCGRRRRSGNSSSPTPTWRRPGSRDAMRHNARAEGPGGTLRSSVVRLMTARGGPEMGTDRGRPTPSPERAVGPSHFFFLRLFLQPPPLLHTLLLGQHVPLAQSLPAQGAAVVVVVVVVVPPLHV